LPIEFSLFLVSLEAQKTLGSLFGTLVAWKVVENLETFGFDLKWLEGRRVLTALSDSNCVARCFHFNVETCWQLHPWRLSNIFR